MSSNVYRSVHIRCHLSMVSASSLQAAHLLTASSSHRAVGTHAETTSRYAFCMAVPNETMTHTVREPV